MKKYAWPLVLLFFVASIAYAQQRYELPYTDGSGSLGDQSKAWGTVYAVKNYLTTGLFGNGTAAAPSITFGSDTDTGAYWVSSGQVGLSVNGTQKWFYDGTRLGTSDGSGGRLVFNGSTVTVPTLLPRGGDDSDTGIGGTTGESDVLSLIVGGTEHTRLAKGGGGFYYFTYNDGAANGASEVFGTIGITGFDTAESSQGAIQFMVPAGMTWAGSATDNPFDIVFYTVPDSSATAAERMRISANGQTQIRMVLTETLVATDDLLAAECGKTIFLDDATGAGYDVALPAIAGVDAGCKFKFIVHTAVGTTAYTISSDAGGDVVSGIVNSGNTMIACDTEDTLTIAHATDAVGDWLEVVSDGTFWYLSGQNFANGFTCTKS